MERKLAIIRTISDIIPIEGADAIELVKVDGWQVVVKKGEFSKGDLCIYVEIDSILDPENPEFAFMQQRHFRVKTIKLRGQLSQGIIFSINILGKTDIWKEVAVAILIGELIGMDVTDALKITKWEPNIPAHLSGLMKGSFPSFLRKTDEERIQNLSSAYPVYRKHRFYVTEKLDDSSFTCYLNDKVFGVCSRNIDLIETEDNAFWKAARVYKLQELLEETGRNLALQGELIGEGIQGNKYQLKGHKIKFFNVFDIDKQEYLSMEEFFDMMMFLGLGAVPILIFDYELPSSIEELLLYADGKSVLNPNTAREGLVLRNAERTISFKVISNKWLLKNEE